MIDKVDEADARFDEFEKTYENTQYLENLSEDIIYSFYRGAIRSNHNREFQDFNQFHRDAYLRLKLRDLPYNLANKSENQNHIDQFNNNYMLERTLDSEKLLRYIDNKFLIVSSFNEKYEKFMKDLLSKF